MHFISVISGVHVPAEGGLKFKATIQAAFSILLRCEESKGKDFNQEVLLEWEHVSVLTFMLS